jgi:transposase InsO family protein
MPAVIASNRLDRRFDVAGPKEAWWLTSVTPAQDVFDYIEMFYNPVRRHGYNGKKSPVEFEQQFFERQRSA